MFTYNCLCKKRPISYINDIKNSFINLYIKTIDMRHCFYGDFYLKSKLHE
jgi:hypothetical protein